MKLCDIIRLSAETEISMGTIRRWAKGERVTKSNRRSLDNAAKVLGIDTGVPVREGPLDDVGRAIAELELHQAGR